MKLKKIASLALAGVMAVSMLAGCANKPGTTDGNKTETTDLSAAVVAALSADTTKTVTFTTNGNLGTAVAALKTKYGTAQYESMITAEDLIDEKGAYADMKASSMEAMPVQSASAKTEEVIAGIDGKTSTALYVVNSDAAGFPVGANDATVAKYLAGQIDTKIAELVKANKLEAKSVQYQVNDAKGSKLYSAVMTYKYTGTVSVYSEADPETGVVSYYMAYTVTRAASQLKSNLD